MVNTVKNFLIISNNMRHMHSKLLQKRAIQKPREARDDFIGNKITNTAI